MNDYSKRKREFLEQDRLLAAVTLVDLQKNKAPPNSRIVKAYTEFHDACDEALKAYEK